MVGPSLRHSGHSSAATGGDLLPCQVATPLSGGNRSPGEALTVGERYALSSPQSQYPPAHLPNSAWQVLRQVIARIAAEAVAQVLAPACLRVAPAYLRGSAPGYLLRRSGASVTVCRTYVEGHASLVASAAAPQPRRRARQAARPLAPQGPGKKLERRSTLRPLMLLLPRSQPSNFLPRSPAVTPAVSRVRYRGYNDELGRAAVQLGGGTSRRSYGPPLVSPYRSASTIQGLPSSTCTSTTGPQVDLIETLRISVAVGSGSLPTEASDLRLRCNRGAEPLRPVRGRISVQDRLEFFQAHSVLALQMAVIYWASPLVIFSTTETTPGLRPYFRYYGPRTKNSKRGGGAWLI